MVGAFGMHGGQERRIWDVEGGNLMERTEGRSERRWDCDIKKDL
jgi:hypothetical protein